MVLKLVVGATNLHFLVAINNSFTQKPPSTLRFHQKSLKMYAPLGRTIWKRDRFLRDIVTLFASMGRNVWYIYLPSHESHKNSTLPCV